MPIQSQRRTQLRNLNLHNIGVEIFFTFFPGKEVAGYRKKVWSVHATAYITVELNGR